MGPTACSSLSERAASRSSDPTARERARRSSTSCRASCPAESADCWAWRSTPTTRAMAACSWPTPASRTAPTSSPSTTSRSNPDQADPASERILIAVAGPGGQPQRRRAGFRAGRVPVHLDGRRRWAERPVRQRPEPQQRAREDPPDRREWPAGCGSRVRHPADQSLRHRGWGARGLGHRHAQPVAHQLRPGVGRPVHRRRRRRVMGRDQPPAGRCARRAELWLAGHGGTALPEWLVHRHRLRAADCRIRPFAWLLDHRRLRVSRNGAARAGGRLHLRGLVQWPRVHAPGRRGHDHAQGRAPERAAGELLRRG